MDTAILVEELDKNAIELIKILDKRNFAFSIATLTKNEDQDDWYLVLGIPGLRIKGWRESLTELNGIITEENLMISLYDLKLVDDKDELFNLLRLKFNTGKEISRIFFNGNYIHGVRFPDSIIYRVTD